MLFRAARLYRADPVGSIREMMLTPSSAANNLDRRAFPDHQAADLDGHRAQRKRPGAITGDCVARCEPAGVTWGRSLIAEGLARPYLCGPRSCPARQPWCGSPSVQKQPSTDVRSRP